MKVSIKNVKFYERLSEETNCYSCDVYYDNRKLFTAKNDGKGGMTDYYLIDKNRDLLESFESYVKTLEPIKYGTLTITIDTSFLIDILFEEWYVNKQKEKYQKKLEKDMLIGIVFNEKDQKNGYKMVKWKNQTISSLLSNPTGRAILMAKKDNLIKDGFIILNTNL